MAGAPLLNTFTAVAGSEIVPDVDNSSTMTYKGQVKVTRITV